MSDSTPFKRSLLTRRTPTSDLPVTRTETIRPLRASCLRSCRVLLASLTAARSSRSRLTTMTSRRPCKIKTGATSDEELAISLSWPSTQQKHRQSPSTEARPDASAGAYATMPTKTERVRAASDLRTKQLAQISTRFLSCFYPKHK